jgi:hypothetical protein
VSRAKWSDRVQLDLTPFFGVITLTFGVIMLLFAAIGWSRFSGRSLVTIVSLVLSVSAIVLAMVFAARPALVRRLGLGIGIGGTLFAVPFVIGGLMAAGGGRFPDPAKLTALASIGIVCSVYAVFAAVALRQELRCRDDPATVP